MYFAFCVQVLADCLKNQETQLLNYFKYAVSVMRIC